MDEDFFRKIDSFIAKTNSTVFYKEIPFMSAAKKTAAALMIIIREIELPEFDIVFKDELEEYIALFNEDPKLKAFMHVVVASYLNMKLLSDMAA